MTCKLNIFADLCPTMDKSFKFNNKLVTGSDSRSKADSVTNEKSNIKNDQKKDALASILWNDEIKHHLATLIAQELKPFIGEVGKRLVDENKEIEELKEIIRQHEDHITCLEKIIKDLRGLLRDDTDNNHTMFHDVPLTDEEKDAQTTVTNHPSKSRTFIDFLGI
jgi:hypothetical protein